MSTTIEYIFSLQDRMSAKIGNISVTSDKMLGKFSDLEKKTNSVTKTFNETGRTIGSLREKINLLQSEREWIPAENIEGIRSYNREMKKLTKEIDKLESLNGGKFKKWSKEAFSALPGSELISNPLVAGAAAVGYAGKEAMNFDEGMAKVNITAQLDEKGLGEVTSKLKNIAIANKTDISVAPIGFEKILSQVGDVDTSLAIMDAALKGSKGGFTDLDTVSGALAQSLSIIGKENTNAKEVLDTLFAAKRVGAGEFADFARYMPNLIAGASSMGINFKEVAGTFAFMTGKGQSAERTATLMENAFSALGKSNIRGNMEKAGIKVFDEQGKMRGMVDIFKDLSGVLNGMTDQQKSSILEKFGLVDKEARSAFAVMTSDLGKFQEAMDATKNATGETDKALSFSANSVQKVTELWNNFKNNILMPLGTFLLPIIGVGIDILGFGLSVVKTILSGVVGVCSWFFNLLTDGNPVILTIAGTLGVLTTMFMVQTVMANATILAIQGLYLWDGIAAGGTWLLAAAQSAYNATLLGCPLVWVVLAVGALVAVVITCWQKFEGFRMAIFGCWEVILEFGKTLYHCIIDPFKQVLSGLGSVGSAIVALIGGNFSDAADLAKKGFADIGSGLLNSTPIGIGVNLVAKGNYSKAWDKGTQDGRNSWVASNGGEHKPSNKQVLNNSKGTWGAPAFVPGTPVQQKVVIPTERKTDKPTSSYEEINTKLGKQKKVKGKGAHQNKLDLNDGIQDYKSSADYTAITKKLSPMMVDLKPSNQFADKTESKIKPTDITARISDNKFSDKSQEYIADKTNYLEDIMINVRKIAAVGAIPLAMNLASPTTAFAQTTEMNTPSLDMNSVNTDSIANKSQSFTQPDMNPQSKSVQIDRVCDQVVIHIQNTDDKGLDTIRTEVMNVLKEIYEV